MTTPSRESQDLPPSSGQVWLSARVSDTLTYVFRPAAIVAGLASLLLLAALGALYLNEARLFRYIATGLHDGALLDAYVFETMERDKQATRSAVIAALTDETQAPNPRLRARIRELIAEEITRIASVETNYGRVDTVYRERLDFSAFAACRGHDSLRRDLLILAQEGQRVHIRLTANQAVEPRALVTTEVDSRTDRCTVFAPPITEPRPLRFVVHSEEQQETVTANGSADDITHLLDFNSSGEAELQVLTLSAAPLALYDKVSVFATIIVSNPLNQHDAS